MAKEEKKLDSESLAFSEVSCCPIVSQQAICETLDFRYRLPIQPKDAAMKRLNYPIEVMLHFRLERCPKGLVLGDPIYSITLLPGEKVRLFTSDRHTRWSYDSDSKLSYRNEATSVESFFTAAMAQAMSDLTLSETDFSASSFSEDWTESSSGGGFFFGLFGGGGTKSSGSYDASSAAVFMRNLRQHAESASRYVSAGVRAKSSVSIGEVEQRTHTQGESEDQYESSSRSFSNPNQCRAVTYLFYQINKLQHISFHLVDIQVYVEDPTAPTAVYQRIPVNISGQVSVLPKAVAANSKARNEVEENAVKSVAERQQVVAAKPISTMNAARLTALKAAPVVTSIPLDATQREKVMSAVQADLADKKLIDGKTLKPTDSIIKELSWERDEALPTPGVLVKGCLDNCETCEPWLQQEIELNLEHKKLENQMLKRQIEILEKSQEYRCCPAGSTETEQSPDA